MGMVVLAFFIGILVMLVLITLHELGHFIVAKLSKAYVYEFSIGFGPRLFTIKGKETWISFRLFPLGGYCSIASDKSDPPKGRDEEVPDERKLDYINRWKKFAFLLAGPLMNFIIALFLITTIFASTQIKKGDMSFYGSNYSHSQIAFNLINNKEKEDNPNAKDIDQTYAIWKWKIFYSDSSGEIAYENELQKENSNQAPTFAKTVYNFIDHLADGEKNRNAQISLSYRKIDKYTGKSIDNISKEVISAKIPGSIKDIENSPERFTKYFVIGDSIGIAAPTRYFSSTLEAYGYGWKETFNASITILKSIGTLFTGNVKQLAGPVGVAKQTAQMLTSADQFFLFVAGISANLFIINLIFIPPLDGYKIVENFIEMIMRKELNRKYKIIVNSVGAILFLTLFIGITIKDFFI